MNYTNTKFFQKIVFDCDSTLVTIEGLDELARKKGKWQEVSELTKLSMEGKVRLEDVFAVKMAMIRPSKKDMTQLGAMYIKTLVEDAAEVISLFKKLNKDVIQVTGNFYPAVKILCDHLGIGEEQIFANSLYFNKHGNYIGFDAQSNLSVSQGKRTIIDEIYRQHPNERIVFVGDGTTDLESKPPVDLFIGYGGVAERNNVKERSDFYITSRSLAPLLRLILTRDECTELYPKNPDLFDKADSLIAGGCVLGV